MAGTMETVIDAGTTITVSIVLREAHRQLVLAWPKRGTSSAGTSLQWEWEEGGERLDAVLWPVVRAAAALLASEE